MRKIIKSILLVAVLVPVAFVMVACYSKPVDSQGHFFRLSWGGSLMNFPTESYKPDYMPTDSYDSLIIAITSVEMLNAMFGETYSQSLNVSQNGWESDERFTNLMNKYNDDFFQTHQLVTFIVTAGNTGDTFEHSETVLQNGKLIVKLTIIHGAGGDALSDWFGIVEIEKVPTNIEIAIQIKNRGW